MGKIYLEAITYDIYGYYWSFLLYGILFYKQILNFFTLNVHRHRNMYVLLSFFLCIWKYVKREATRINVNTLLCVRKLYVFNLWDKY